MLRQFKDYASSFFEFAGKKAAIAYALVFSGALLEGVGFLLLLPFLEMFSGAKPSGFTQNVIGIFDSFGITGRTNQLLMALAGFLVLLLLRNIIGWYRDTRIMRLSFGFVDQWRSRIFSAISAAPWSTLMAYKRTDLEHAITTDVSRLTVGTDRILRGSVTLLMMLVQVIVALWLSPALTAMVLVFLGVAGVLLFPTMLRARKLGEFLTQSGRKVHGILGQFMTGLKLAKAHNAETSYLNRFTSDIKTMREHTLQFAADQAFTRAIFQVVSGIVICFIIILGLFVLDIPVSVLIVVLIILGRLTGPFLTLVQSAQSFANMLPAFDSLRKTEQALIAAIPTSPPLQNRSEANPRPARPVGPAEIKLKKVHFKHEGQTDWVLNDISCTFESGKISALLGASGAGKTTLVDILCGLLRPTKGEIEIDNIVADPTNHTAHWDDTLAYVPQDPFLFDLTLRENLLWPSTDTNSVDDPSIWKALDTAGAADFVRAKKDQLDFRAGERGQAFSGGERQRLCLARALLRKPRLLILDEATNAIDMELETRLLERLKALKGKVTIIIITHRPASAGIADKVLRLESGKVV